MNESMIGGPVLTNWLAIVGIISLMYWGWRIVATVQHRTGKSAPADAVSSAAPTSVTTASVAAVSGPPPEDIAVIAAAVHAMMGAHRIVHLESSQTGRTWAAEGRWMHQTSHRPG